jgi:2TM domain
MAHDISHEKGTDTAPMAPAASDQLARDQAVKQIERRRRFWMRATMGTLFMLILAVIWALAEYHNSGGWPTRGFSQSSGVHDVWNYWIIYPAIAWALLTAGDAWRTFGRKPVSEADIQREMKRQSGQR